MPPAVEAVLLLTAVMSAFVLAERVGRWRRVDAPLGRDHLRSDLAWFLVALAAAVVSTLIIQPVLAPLAIESLSTRIDAMPPALNLLLAVAAFDATTFGIHLVLHRVDWLWSFHKVHHSSRHLDSLATTRTHMFEHLVRNVPAQAVLLTIGFPASTIASAIGIYLAFAVFGHSNLRSPNRVIEAVFVTPRLHLLHHIPATTQTNFGTVFSIWDRALGRLTTTDHAAGAALGVPDEVETYPQPFTTAARTPFRQIADTRHPGRSIHP